ncbi:unnamed protein product, partial [Gulo gulo]
RGALGPAPGLGVSAGGTRCLLYLFLFKLLLLKKEAQCCDLRFLELMGNRTLVA